MNLRNLAMWAVIVILTIGLYNMFKNPQGAVNQKNNIIFSEFLTQVDNGRVVQVEIQGKNIKGVMSNGEMFNTYAPDDPNLIQKLSDKGVSISASPLEEKMPSLFGVLLSWFPMLLLIAVWIFFMRQMQGGKGGAMGFGKSKAKMMNELKGKVTFNDVAGVEEAKEEVEELVDFLKDPSKFQKLGGKIPKGVLMVGSPGTGKTLLARAIAGEAKVPFFTISGSDFVEMFVGVGASRVRDMFAQATKHAPCIIFIDEIDAVGRHRGAGVGGGHDEREQTLNQLLVEMDGFEGHEGTIVIAATNRPDVLDPALLRPGRFDRQVVVPLPDIRGREQILKVHMRKVPIADDVVASIIARGTPGFSGADLANLVNEAALFSARSNNTKVGMNEFELAKDKIMMGAERKSMVMSEDEKKLTAYHESGHAIVGRLVPEHDPVHKVTIIPRGRALGVTMFLPEDDRYSNNKQRLESQICTLYGGRIAEELIYGKDKVTTGASNDIERATEIAKNMVTKWGLSEKMGPMSYSDEEGEVFLGRSVTQTKTMSDDTANDIDSEVRLLVDKSYTTATKMIKDNMDKLHAMSEALMTYETIDKDQIDDIMAGIKPRPPKGWDDKNDDDDKSSSSSSDIKESGFSDPASNH